MARGRPHHRVPDRQLSAGSPLCRRITTAGVRKTQKSSHVPSRSPSRRGRAPSSEWGRIEISPGTGVLEGSIRPRKDGFSLCPSQKRVRRAGGSLESLGPSGGKERRLTIRMAPFLAPFLVAKDRRQQAQKPDSRRRKASDPSPRSPVDFIPLRSPWFSFECSHGILLGTQPRTPQMPWFAKASSPCPKQWEESPCLHRKKGGLAWPIAK
jgi:hypothetical protein